MSEEALVKIGIKSLAGIFDLVETDIVEKMTVARIFNWSTDKFSLGGYSYQSLHIEENKKIIKAPVDDTLYFAGEALSADTEAGTVEAAMASGMSAAGEILVN